MNLNLPLYLGLGVVQDYLIAKYYMALSRRSVIVASFLGALITGLTFLVIDLSFGRWDRVVAYVVGTGIGTALALRGQRVSN